MLFIPSAPVGTLFYYPPGQSTPASRAAHMLLKAQQAAWAPSPPGLRFVGLAAASQTLRQAYAAAGIDPLADRGLIAMPLWAWPAVDRARLNARLPVR